MTPDELAKKTILGLVEEVTLHGKSNERTVPARIDSGATKSSIDLRLASDLRLGPIVESKLIKSANGAKLRPVIETRITVGGKDVTTKFTMADRSHMKYPILIGQNILKEGFLIDPCKQGKHDGPYNNPRNNPHNNPHGGDA